MEGSIALHPEKGVNPRLTICRRCGKDVGIAMFGRINHKYTCSSCGCIHYGPPDRVRLPVIDRRACQKCGEGFGTHWKKEVIDEHEKIPIEVCDDCIEKQKASDDAVKAGGIYWRCEDCGSEGAIIAEHDLSKHVRKEMDIEPPKPCGVALNRKYGCPICAVDDAVEKAVEEACSSEESTKSDADASADQS